MLKAGFSKVDVTPPLGSPIAGYFKERIADGILDPIELVALALNDGENTVLIITADFTGIWEKWATEIRNLISEHTGVPAGNIYIHALHQHTSVRIGYNPHLYEASAPNTFSDSAYYDILYRKFVDVSKMAMNDLCEAEMGVAQERTSEELSFIRRFRMKDGSVKTNPSRKKLEDIEGPLGEADNIVRLVRFKREDAKDIALVNFSTHPDTIGGTKFSADWPGFVRRMTESDIPNTHCILLNGAQGDTNHTNRFVEPTSLSKYEYCAFMGRVITDTVISLWDKTEKKEVQKVSGEVRMNYVPTNMSHIDEVEKYQKLKKEYNEGTYVPKGMEEQADIFRVSELYSQSLFQKVPISVVSIGEVVFVGFGGEPFTQYAADIRDAEPNLFILTSCNTNGQAGYFPTKEAFEEGGYECHSSNFTDALPNIVQQAIKDMLDRIKTIYL